MREAIGSSLLLNIVIVIIGIISAFLISSIAYSKAFKAKSRIISVIEEYGDNCNFNDYTNECKNKIESVLSDMGYSSNISYDCHDLDDHEHLVYDGSDGHRYCVNRYTLCDYSSVTNGCKDDSNVSYYYKVYTFMHFDIPLIGQFLEFKVSGETKLFNEKFINIE